MKIGIIGARNIGSALAVHFRNRQHTVHIANSRGPETLAPIAQETGATPVPLANVAAGADLLVLAIPMKSVPSLPKDLLAAFPADAPILDTGNYIPQRDGTIPEIEAGLTESQWTARVLQRPVLKVFNSITTHSLAHGDLPHGADNRIALPVAGDNPAAKQFVIALLDTIGFDGIDAGPLSESWRQQPGTPAYATDLDAEKLPAALARADRADAPRMRDAMLQKLFSLPLDTPPQEIVRLARSFWPDPTTTTP